MLHGPFKEQHMTDSDYRTGFRKYGENLTSSWRGGCPAKLVAKTPGFESPDSPVKKPNCE